MTRSPTLLFGATSILGFQLARSFPSKLLPFVTPGSRAPALRGWPVLHLDNCAWIERLVRKHQPSTLIYCHAVCDVPKCEAAPDWAQEMNIAQLRRVLTALSAHTRLVYVSSDHVFGGDGVYHEESSPCPISVYGKTRVAAEDLVLNRRGGLVIRVGLPIGPSPNGRTGHLDWLRYRIQRNLPVTIVRDEYRTAVWAGDVAARIMGLSESGAIGMCHITSTRAVSRVELANHLLSLLSLVAEFHQENRSERSAPHLGRVELATVRRGALYEPLACVLDGSAIGQIQTSLDTEIALDARG
jgi:dTDP-4-dehydrorhamnose reductase